MGLLNLNIKFRNYHSFIFYVCTELKTLIPIAKSLHPLSTLMIFCLIHSFGYPYWVLSFIASIGSSVSTTEDSTWSGFKAYNSPFCISGAVMGFLKIPLSRKDLNTKESRKLLLKSLKPFLLRTSLIFSYLLHNSMSQELFGEASKLRNKKKKENRTRKIGREISDDKLYTINLLDDEYRQNRRWDWESYPTISPKKTIKKKK